MKHGATVMLLVAVTLPAISCGDLSDTDETQDVAELRRRRGGQGGMAAGGATGTGGAAGVGAVTGAGGVSGTSGTGGVTGAGGASGTGAGGNVGSAFQAIAPCASESSFVRAGVVVLRAGFSPACARLASGGTVMFLGSFSEHPLRRRAGGTTPSPIQGTNSGGGVEYEFPDQGFFAFECAVHPNEVGVIWSSTN